MKVIIILLLCFSCSRNYSIYKKTKRGNIFITPIATDLKSAEILPWKVGRTFKQSVSKGIRLEIQFPSLKKEDLASLTSSKKVDSWLITVEKATRIGKDIIGSRYIPLLLPGNFKRSRFRVKQMKSGFIDIYYAAAALSKRFENFHCPAFDHNLVINNIKIISRKKTLKKMFVSPMERRSIPGRVEAFSYLPSVLNGGTELKGKYIIKLALFNSKSKKTQSSYFELPATVEVLSESPKTIKGCSNFTIPERKKRTNQVNRFRWKR